MDKYSDKQNKFKKKLTMPVLWCWCTLLIYIIISVVWILAEYILYGERHPSTEDSIIAVSIAVTLSSIITYSIYYINNLLNKEIDEREFKEEKCIKGERLKEATVEELRDIMKSEATIDGLKKLKNYINKEDVDPELFEEISVYVRALNKKSDKTEILNNEKVIYLSQYKKNKNK